MYKFLGKLLWIVVPIIIGLIGGYFITIYQQKDMELTAYVYPERVVIDTLLSPSFPSGNQPISNLKKGFKAFFDGKEIGNLMISFVEIRNTGDLPIQEIPIQFSFPGSNLLEYSMSLPLGMKDNDMVELTKDQSNLELRFNYLNVDESITFDFKLDAASGQKILVNSRQKGMTFIQREAKVSEPDKVSKQTKDWIYLVMMITISTSTFIAFLSSILSRRSRYKKKE